MNSVGNAPNFGGAYAEVEHEMGLELQRRFGPMIDRWIAEGMPDPQPTDNGNEVWLKTLCRRVAENVIERMQSACDEKIAHAVESMQERIRELEDDQFNEW